MEAFEAAQNFATTTIVVGLFIMLAVKVYGDSAKREERMSRQIDKFGESLDSFNVTLTSMDRRLETLETTVIKSKKNF